MLVLHDQIGNRRDQGAIQRAAEIGRFAVVSGLAGTLEEALHILA